MAGLMTALLVLGSMVAPPVGAKHIEPLVQILPYDFSIHVPSEVVLPMPEAPKIPVIPEPECDEEGITSVRFCMALEEDFNRVTIQIWDTGNPTPIPIGAQYTFRDDSGNVLLQQVMCGQKNTWVPESADELLVELAHPNSFVHEDHPFGVCAAAPFEGEVRLRWMHGAPGEPGATPEPDPCPDCNDVCQCECHPIFGCECDCGDH